MNINNMAAEVIARQLSESQAKQLIKRNYLNLSKTEQSKTNVDNYTEIYIEMIMNKVRSATR